MQMSIAKVMQENILLRTELKRVQKANDELSRHCRTKRQLQQGETLSLQDIQELETQNDVQGQIFKEEAKAEERKDMRRRLTKQSRQCQKSQARNKLQRKVLSPFLNLQIII